MAASGVNDVLRAHQGAVKRFWNKINAVKTTAGTTSAFTLAFDVGPAAYADGEIVSFVVNATSAAAATIKVNALGAKALRLFGGNLLAGALLTGQIVQARYNSSAGAFDIIPQNGWVRIGEQDPRGASAVDFTSIPAGVKHLHCMFALRPSTNGVRIDLQTDGADGVLDTAASDYGYAGTAVSSTPATGVIGSGGNSSIILSETTNVSNGDTGFSGDFSAADIQAATRTKFNYRTFYLATGGPYNTITGAGLRNEADRITGIRFVPSSGTVTGKITLLASA